MNWQCPSTRAIASSTERPRRRRCAATSMNGIVRGPTWPRGFIKGSRTDRIGETNTSAGQPPRPGPATTRAGNRAALEAADGDLKTCHAFLAGHDGLPAVADRSDKGLQLGAQRLSVTDREMAHGVAAV